MYIKFCVHKFLQDLQSFHFVFKGNTQFIFLCNPPKLGASRVYITFLQITQKILTKDIFHWLELITEILSFLQIFTVRKTTTPLFYYFKNSVRISKKKLDFWHILSFQKQIPDNSCGYLHCTVSS